MTGNKVDELCSACATVIDPVNDSIAVLDACGVVREDGVEHAPSVPWPSTVVDVRIRESPTITFVPLIWRHMRFRSRER